MRDPFFAHLMFLIEQMISEADVDARAQGVTLRDSQVQSALTKARGLASGKSPRIEEATDADRVLRTLILSIDHAPNELIERSIDPDGLRQEKPLDAADWIMAIETVIDSIKTRRSEIPGSRDYLDFVEAFVKRAKKSQ